MCECREEMDECRNCEHPSYREDIVDAIRTQILPGLAGLLETDRLAREELAGLEAEQKELQRRARELENQVRELSHDQYGGPAVRAAIIEANAEGDEITKKLDSLRHCLEPVQCRAAHTRQDLNMAGQRALRDLQAEFQARLRTILDEAADLCDSWTSAVREVGTDAGIDFGPDSHVRLDILDHPMIGVRRFGRPPLS